MKQAAEQPRVVKLPGDTPFKDVKARCKRDGLRPTIDSSTMQWVLRPNLRRVK